MKKLFFILISVFLSTSVFSQEDGEIIRNSLNVDCVEYCPTCPPVDYGPGGNSVQRLWVDNQTDCEQYIVVFGGKGCTECSNLPYMSDFIPIPPMTTITLDSPTLLAMGLAGTYIENTDEYIAGARVIDNHPESSCPCICGCTLGQPECAGTLSTYSFMSKTLNCEDCVYTTAVWYPGECEIAELIFTP